MIGPVPPRPTGSSSSARFFQWVHDTLVHQQLSVRNTPRARVSRTTRGTIVEPDPTAGGGIGRVKKLILADHEPADHLICRAWNEEYWTARRTLLSASTSEDPPTEQEIADEMATIKGTDPADELAALQTYLADEIIVAKARELRMNDFDTLTIPMQVESWNGTVLSATTRKLSFDYKSAAFRIVTDKTDPDEEDWVTEKQTIIPRFIPEETIIYAITSDQTEMEVDEVAIKLIDLNIDARAWMRTR